MNRKIKFAVIGLGHIGIKHVEAIIKDQNSELVALADKLSFEEIKKKTGKSESDVIKIMRKYLKPSSFKLWRERV